MNYHTTISQRRPSRRDRTTADVIYDFCWFTKNHRPILTGDLVENVKAGLSRTASENGLNLLHSRIDSTTVQLRVIAPAFTSPHTLVSRLKAATHRDLSKENPSLLARLNGIWAQDSYIATVGSAPSGAMDDWVMLKRGFSQNVIAQRRAQEATSHVG